MKILNNVEIPLPLMEVFTDWCNITNYPITPESFEHFANDCFINYIDLKKFDNHYYNTKEKPLSYSNGIFDIGGFILYDLYRRNIGTYIEMKDKLDEIKRIINT